MTETPNLRLDLIPANTIAWTDRMNANMKLLDAAFGAYFTLQDLQGVWTNSHAYTEGQTVVDGDTGTVWTCQVDHTSAMIGTTFAEERTNNPTYWTVYSSPARARGAWTGPGTVYAVNDFVVSGSKYAVCIVAHTSGLSFDIDEAAGKWSTLVDLSAAGSQVLPVPGGAADANKAVLTTPAGTGYSIYNMATLLSLLGATTVGEAVFKAVSAAAARTAIDAQVAGSYQASDATLTALSGQPTNAFGIALLNLLDAVALRSATGATFPASLSLVGTTDTQTLTNKTINGNNNTISKIAVPGHIYGLGLSTAGSSTTISFAAGSAVDSTGVFFMSGSALDKTTASWAAGNAQGMLDTGTIANSTQYHHFLIATAAGVTDYLCSLSPTAPTMPSGYTYFRRIGSIKTNGSGQWQTFQQEGDDFYTTLVSDFTAGTTSGWTLRTLSVPTGIIVKPLIQGVAGSYNNNVTLINVAPASNSVVYQTLAYANNGNASHMYLEPGVMVGPPTNTSAQIYVEIPYYSLGATVQTVGWRDARGKDSGT